MEELHDDEEFQDYLIEREDSIEWEGLEEKDLNESNEED